MLVVEAVGKRYEPPPSWLRPFVKTAVRAPIEALTDVSLTVDRGEIIGLVGPNGAGKTTLLKIIATLLEPSAGRVAFDGLDPRVHAIDVRRGLGLVLEGDQGLYGRLSGRQNLELYARLAGASRDVARARAGEMLEMLGLAQRDKLVFGYSAGMKMRLSIARALVADPSLVVLDEPTRSLDPIASRFAMGLFRDLAAQGRGVILSNHRLDEVVTICTRIVAIVHGGVRFAGPPSDLAASHADAARALSDLIEREAGMRP
jgi:ABC-2 type transport system ATP-binding protein